LFYKHYFIAAAPTTEELEVYNELHALIIQPTTQLLEYFKRYQPASDSIRDAIASPSRENEDKAWEAVMPTVDMLRTFYNYSSELGKMKKNKKGCESI
jgi:hypothetical protein